MAFYRETKVLNAIRDIQKRIFYLHCAVYLLTESLIQY